MLLFTAFSLVSISSNANPSGNKRGKNLSNNTLNRNPSSSMPSITLEESMRDCYVVEGGNLICDDRKILPNSDYATDEYEQKPSSSPMGEWVASCTLYQDKDFNECMDDWKNRTATGGGSCNDTNQQFDPTTQSCITKKTEPSLTQPSPDEPSPVDLCIAAHESAMSSCDSEKGNWMSGINDVTQKLGSVVNQVNPSTCGGIAAASSGAAASLATFELMCNSATSECVEKCTDPTQLKLADQCKTNGTKASEARQSVSSAMLTLRGSVTACKNAFGDLNTQAQAHCATNPAACQFELPGAIQAKAFQSDQAGGGVTSGLSGDGAKSAQNDRNGGFNLSDLGDDEDRGIGDIKPSRPGEEIGGGKGGGSVAGGSAGQGDGGSGRGGGKREGGLLSNILSGFFGSGGGSGGGGWKSFFGGNKSNDSYDGNRSSNVQGGPDLRKFLPGAVNDPARNRGIAGQFIGRDGMTGPHSNIWLNIKNRYQSKRASLIP